MKHWLALGSIATIAAAVSPASPVAAQEVQDISSLGWDFDAVEIRTEQVADGLYVLFGLGGNVAVSVGQQGVLIVDDMFPELQPKIDAAIRAVGGGPVDFAINTHWHFDHAQGNLAFGPAGTWIVAQRNSRRQMIEGATVDTVSVQFRQEPYPLAAQAVISYEDTMSFHLNGSEILLVHAGPGHTAGDTAVIFREANAVHMGDVFNHSGYPFIDAGSGGSIDGMISFCRAIYAEMGPDAIVIPGHGEITDGRALAAYTDMLSAVRERVASAIEEGGTLEEVVASKPTAEFDAAFQKQSNPDDFVNRVYTSLTN